MDIVEINTEINRLEGSDTNYSNCDKLATLYTVRNGLVKDPVADVPLYSYASAPSASDFINAFKKAPTEEALLVLDEHMECIKTLFPKEYNVILRKLKNLY